MASRFPSVSANTGIGYETDGKEGFDNVVEFRFDYSNVDNTVREVKKQLSDLSYDIHKTFKGMSIQSTKTANKQFTISPKATADLDRTDAGIMRMNIAMLGDGERIANSLAPAMRQIGEEGKQTMKKYANRIDTGRMNESIYYSTRKLKGSYVVRIGWTKLWFKYFGFQENGTENIRPMRSVFRTFLEMQPRVSAFANKFIRSYSRTGRDAGGVNYR
jgi:DNA-directed RNA polymerase beta' subunit